MSGMKLHLDDLSEAEGHVFEVDVSAHEATRLIDDTTYRAVAPLRAQLEASLTGSTVRVAGPVQAHVEFECGKCLESRQRALDINAEFVLMARSEWEKTYESDDELELNDDDMDVSFYEGEELDLAPLLREAMLLELPAYPRCPPEGKEACDEAYRRNVGGAALDELEEAALDQRWAALKDIKLKD